MGRGHRSSALGIAIGPARVLAYRIQKLRIPHQDWFREDFRALIELLREGRIHPVWPSACAVRCASRSRAAQAYGGDGKTGTHSSKDRVGARGGARAQRCIAEHGLIGDLHTVALVGTDGTIDWYCCPRFDSPSVFAAILDADRGGSFRISPDCDGWSSSSCTCPTPTSSSRAS